MKLYYFIFSSSLLIGLVLLIRKIFRKKLSPAVIYAMWLIPLIRFMTPFVLWEFPVYGITADIWNSPYKVVSEWLTGERIENSVEQMEIENTSAQLNDGDTVKISSEDNPIAESEVTWSEKQTTMTTTPEPIQTSDITDTKEVIPNLLVFIWTLGSITVGGYTWFSNRKWYQYIKAAESIDRINGVSVYINDDIAVPCLTGIFQPKILMNNEIRSNPELYEYVIQHEMMHYNQKDHIWTLIRILICVIYWWNPLVWLAANLAGEDAELSCDAKVLKGKSTAERKAYGYALLQILENTQKNRKIMYAATSMSGGRNSIKRRIEEITDETKTVKVIFVLTMIILAAVFVLGCTIPTRAVSWLETTEWETGKNDEVRLFHEADYNYKLQKNMQSILAYYEIYEYGELIERSILSCGKIEDHTGNIKVRKEHPQNIEHVNWIVEFNGIGIEMEAPIYDYDIEGYSSTALNDEKAVEIEPERDFVLMADFGGKKDETTHLFDCKQLSEYTEEQLQEQLKNNYVVVLLRFVVSEKDTQELYDTYVEKEVAAEGNRQNSEIIYSEDITENKMNTDITAEDNVGTMDEENTQDSGAKKTLEFDFFLDAAANKSIEQIDWSNFPNMNRKFFDEYSLNYYISYDLKYENQRIRLDFYYMKEDNQLSKIYLHKEDDNILWIYDYEEEKQRVTAEEIVEFIRRDDNILNEISFDLPEGLSLDAYSAFTGYEGGCLFLPIVYERNGDSEFAPDSWMASGLVSRYTQASILEWEDDKISNIYPYYNHTSREVIEQVEGLCAPALLAHFNHDLYTAGELGRLEEEGVDISALETTSDYWYLFIAKPGEEYGYVVTLNQKNFTKEDILDLGKTIEIIK